MRRNNQTPRSDRLAMNLFKDLIQRCHQRHKKPLLQRETTVSPALYKNYPYHFTVRCAYKYPVTLYQLEQADISFMPIGRAPQHDHSPRDFGGERFLKRQGTRDWIPRRWYASWGIQIYTGIPSERDGAQWHDIDFKYDVICASPDAVSTCIETLVNSVANPLLVLSKSGGLRFSCRVQDYLHPNTDEAKQYIYKHASTAENLSHRDVYLEILGDKGYSRWDARYEILLGNLLDPPIITKEVLFAPIDALRDALHQPAPPSEYNLESTFQTAAQPVPDPINEKVVAVREGELSPLAIKRPSPVVHKLENSDAARQTSALCIIKHDQETGQLRAINQTGERTLSLECRLSKEILEAWGATWKQNALGNFAKALLNALEIKSEFRENPVGRVRAALQAFQGQEEILIRQMSEENLDPDLNSTFWHQLKHFFTYYKRDADAPMIWDEGMLRFWVPSVLDEAFPDEVESSEPKPWLPGNRVFQIRTGIYSVHELLNYENSWEDLGLSEIGQRFLLGIRAEIERDPSVKHALLVHEGVVEELADIREKENVRCLTHVKYGTNAESIKAAFESADAIWIVGVPYWPPHLMWKQAQILFGNSEEPICYDVEINPYQYEDERIQGLYEQNIIGILTQIVGDAGLDRLSNKTVMLLTGMPLPNITDRSETLLFDWEDFEVAGGLNKLEETVTTRQHFETERANLTGESDREKVEQVLGISKSQANRVLMKLRGRKLRPASFQEQICALLEGGEKKTAELIAAIDGHPGAVKNELKRLVDIGEVVKVQRATYILPKT